MCIIHENRRLIYIYIKNLVKIVVFFINNVTIMLNVKYLYLFDNKYIANTFLYIENVTKNWTKINV